jgi:cold shock CspA family protein
MNDQLVRIGIFYDGNFFSVVSDYYAYHHERSARISISGLHEYVRSRVAHEEHVDPRFCQVLDVHYFRGRFTAAEVEAAGKLLADRKFDDVLVREGVTTHYLPMGYSGTEKGIDVWFALEAYELAIYKRFDVCVLVAGDSDYVPLARKLNTLGARVMVLGWDFEYSNHHGRVRTTKTSQTLLDEVTYPVLLSTTIEDKTQKDAVKGLFLPRLEPREQQEHPGHSSPTIPSLPTARQSGRIQNLVEREAENKRFGWITPAEGSPNIWFGERDLEDSAFTSVVVGAVVTYEMGSNWEGPCAKRVRMETNG